MPPLTPQPLRKVGAKHSDFSPLLLRYDPITNHFVLVEDFVTPEYTVPKGEYTDGATRPEWAELIGVRDYDRHLYACVVHDWMYRHSIATKKQADDLFETNLLRCHELFSFPYELIDLMVAAVRIGGKGAY